MGVYERAWPAWVGQIMETKPRFDWDLGFRAPGDGCDD
jgi:hypothetical protein